MPKALRRVRWHVAVPVVLMGVLVVLAVLQYRWLGQVSEAERNRMRETMTTRARDLAVDIDRELSRMYEMFRIDPAEMPHLARVVAARHEAWRKVTRNPGLLQDIYLVTGAANQTSRIEKYDLTEKRFVATEWPARLHPIRDRTAQSVAVPATMTPRSTTPAPPPAPSGATAAAPTVTQTVLRGFPAQLTPDPLALGVVLNVMTFTASGANGVLQAHVPVPTYLLLVLNEDLFKREMLKTFVQTHLGSSLDEFRVAIVRTREPHTPVYESAGPIRMEDADIREGALMLRPTAGDRMLATEVRSASLSMIRLEEVQRAAQNAASARRAPRTNTFVMVPGTVTRPDSVPRDSFVFQAPGVAIGGVSGGGGRTGGAAAGARGGGGAGGATTAPTQQRTTTNLTQPQGAWQVLLHHRAGGLERHVAQLRRRNLAMSFGMLALLGSSVGLVLMSARRAERLASQQMDFVATVSHELRTPLAVIRSAGQNLAAGVVQDPKRYGELIETEGRRLTDMVEQTLVLAGLSGDRRPVAQNPIDAGDVVRAVLASPETSSRADGIDFELRVAEELPLVLGDEVLLLRAVQNLVGNAIKYGAGGRWIGVTVDAAGARRGREVRITVSDRGPGVPAADLPHIFDAFYRGKKAVADQVQGNGLGLHLVKRIAEAHGGRVSVRSAAGDGAAFTIHIPARADVALHAIGDEQPQHS